MIPNLHFLGQVVFQFSGQVVLIFSVKLSPYVGSGRLQFLGKVVNSQPIKFEHNPLKDNKDITSNLC